MFKDGTRQFTSDWYGELNYSAALSHQTNFRDRVGTTSVAHVMGLEHPNVITLGRRQGESGTGILNAEGFQVQPTDRGGQATLHNPGQLVVYPIFPLREWRLGVREFVEGLELALQNCLEEWDIPASPRSCDSGLYTQRGKVAFIGLRVERGVSYHGISLNVCNDLMAFGRIVPCGQKGLTVDRLQNHGVDAEPRVVFERLLPHLEKVFSLTRISE